MTPATMPDWSSSWNTVSVTEAQWHELRGEVMREFNSLTKTLGPGPQWDDGAMLSGAMGVMAHGAWHLGAIRQLIALVSDERT